MNTKTSSLQTPTLNTFSLIAVTSDAIYRATVMNLDEIMIRVSRYELSHMYAKIVLHIEDAHHSPSNDCNVPHRFAYKYDKFTLFSADNNHVIAEKMSSLEFSQLVEILDDIKK